MRRALWFASGSSCLLAVLGAVHCSGPAELASSLASPAADAGDEAIIDDAGSVAEFSISDTTGESVGCQGIGCAGDTGPEPTCGDGRIDAVLHEQCDDGNTASGDGCSGDCLAVEKDFACPMPGQMCMTTVRCGDGKIGGTEQCDDGNANGNDGCSATCQLEDGWICPRPATRCTAASCGDGKLAGAEQCDDGNVLANDGCGPDCTVESAPVGEKDGWQCPVPNQPCTRTNCGDGMAQGSEQCDDGNNDTGDGCSPFCKKEPACPAAGGACASSCGDGLLLDIDKTMGQECDDGNTVSGDGCAKDCKKEMGFQCNDTMVVPNPLVLPIVFRDFKAFNETNGHPDFENLNGQETGIVQSALGANGKPQHVLMTKTKEATTYDAMGALTSPDYFAMWYKDTPDYNKTILQSLTFTTLASGAYQYANTSFFLLDGLGWGNYASSGHNFHFTSEVRYWFEYSGNEQLDFTGDDDVWVFINKKLAVDIGGIHGAKDGGLILDAANGHGMVCDLVTVCPARRDVDFGLQIGKVYEIVVFQAERHTSASNYKLTLSKFNSTRSVCKSVCGDGIVTSDEECDDGTAKNTGAYNGCSALCTRSDYCGDGVKNGPEECDDGSNLTPYDPTGVKCAPGCKKPSYCGDGIVDSVLAGEQCDDGKNDGGYGECFPGCVYKDRCGDGIVNGPEQCDDGNRKNGDGCNANCRRDAIPN